ncbi:amidohydrolase [Mycolicibacterium sp. 018/SC-01/001]|nr:amidohydrolase [Mycolicibacterium sp. 018/SC-01/001]
MGMSSSAATAVFADLSHARDWQENLYRDIHHHPELSHQEHRTAGLVADRLRQHGFDVHEGVGGTGVVGILRNGDGPSVLLRADMDALPVEEATGLPYASTVRTTDKDGDDVPVMHACGHDVHVVCLLGAAALLAAGTDHCEVAPNETAVLTVGSIHAGSKSNVIGDHAVLQLNMRTYDEAVRTAVLAAIKRIVIAECQASGSPRDPDFELYDRFPLTVNDESVTEKVSDAFAGHFGDRLIEMPQGSASEDFSDIPNALGVPYTYWGIGGIDRDTYRAAVESGRVAQDIPVNHSPTFAPVVQPTLDTGTEALVVAALAWLDG